MCTYLSTDFCVLSLGSVFLIYFFHFFLNLNNFLNNCEAKVWGVFFFFFLFQHDDDPVY